MASAQEILMWALVNRARLNPGGEGIDINEGGVTDFNKVPVTLTGTSKQPLAWNDNLAAAADLHSQNMLDRDFFAHDDPGTGKGQGDRTKAAGYVGNTGENISWQGYVGTVPAADAVATQHQSLFWDLKVAGRGHRYNILLDSYQEVGIGQQVGKFTFTDSATGQLRTLDASMITQDFGKPSAGGQFLTGIAYNDTDGNRFYSATDTTHEGRGGVVVTTTAGNVTTAAVGNYSKAISAGVQTISFSGGGLPATVSASIDVAAGRNALVNLVDTSTLETSVSLTALNGVTKIIGLGNLGLTLTGNALDNTIFSALGNDKIDGGIGTDTAAFSGNRASYTITNNANGTVTVAGLDGTDILTSIEKLLFKDQTVVLSAPTPPPPPANKIPVVAVADHSLKSGETAKIAPWVFYSDADGNAATQYQIIDNGTAAGSGFLIAPNGSQVAAGTTLTVTAADLANVSIRGGTAAGTETMQIRAFDGKDWSAWDSFNFTTTPLPVNTAPVVTIDDKSLNVNQWAKVADWIKYSDANGNAAVQYQFVDKYDAANSGYFYTPDNVHHAANEVFTVNAADLGNVWVRGAKTGGWENMQVRAFDGTDWSAWDNFKLTTLPNVAPVATIDDKTVKTNQWLKISDVLKFFDADGNAAVQYQFVDKYAGTGSGYFYTPDNVQHAANEVFTVSAADLGNVWVRGAQGAGWETMQVRAYDGMNWGAWDDFKLTTVVNSAPVATIDDKIVSKNEWVQVSTLLKTTDADGDPITQFRFIDKYDAADSGYFYTPDNIHHAANQIFTVNAADLANVWVRGGAVAGWENMRVAAFDGETWGAWDTFKFTTLNNSAPVVSGASDFNFGINKKVAASSLYSVIDGDVGDKVTQYQYYDDTVGGGSFNFAGKVQAADTTITVNAADIAKLAFVSASTAANDLLWVRANDGDIWSDWHQINAHTIV